MFSGIVEESAQVVSFIRSKGAAVLRIKGSIDHKDTNLGDSVAIDGVCLTVVENEKGMLSFEISEETLRRSTLGALKEGDAVHVERSLILGDRIHGHLVFGHVDSTIELLSRTEEGGSEKLTWKISPELRPYIAEKGSVSISGISLTVGSVNDASFAVYIVPHTKAVTKLGTLKVGDRANFEIDMLSRYVREHVCR